MKLQLKPETPELDDDSTHDLKPIRRARTYVLELPDHARRRRFGSSRNHVRIKWSVGKARRAGVSVREAASETDVRAWYRLHTENDVGARRCRRIRLRSSKRSGAGWRRLASRG
jgi:hypothetical protein